MLIPVLLSAFSTFFYQSVSQKEGGIEKVLESFQAYNSNTMRLIVMFLCFLGLTDVVSAQLPKANPYFVRSPFPAVHGGNYRQASQLEKGPQTDKIKVFAADLPGNTASPWLLVSDKYPNGERVYWMKNGAFVFKVLSTNNGLEVVATYSYGNKFRPNYNLILFKDHELWIKSDNEFTILTESDTTNPRSAIVLKRKINVTGIKGDIIKQGVLYDGNIVFTTKKDQIGVMNRAGKLLDILKFDVPRKDIPYHNDFAIDEKNNVYIVSNSMMLSFGWNGKKLVENWRAKYDFGGNRLQGSGTTPTLMGTGDMDKLVLVCDSHTPANMVAFWREKPPVDWKGITGQSKQLAGICPLPGATPPKGMFTAVENSPVCWGYGIAAAQYNGFTGQPCNTIKGVYKCEWDSTVRRLNLKWHRNDINMNNVLCYSVGSDMVYGSGREQDCNYYYYGLDWKNGSTIWRKKLGNSDDNDDPGNANVLDENGHLIFSSKRKVIQLRVAQ
jgi:hypothetical protein